MKTERVPDEAIARRGVAARLSWLLAAMAILGTGCASPCPTCPDSYNRVAPPANIYADNPTDHRGELVWLIDQKNDTQLVSER
jgi:hypothetical protein